MEKFLLYLVEDGFLAKEGFSVTKNIDNAWKFKNFEEADLIKNKIQELFGNEYTIQSYKIK